MDKPQAFTAFEVLFWTGIREGELLALMPGDFDFGKGLLHITKSASWKGGGVRISTPKTRNSVRDVPLLDPLRAVLEPRRGKPGDYVLSDAPEPLTDGQYHHRWLEYCKALGMVEISESGERYRAKRRARDSKGVRVLKELPPVLRPAVTAHQFRHEMASAMYEAKVGELEAQEAGSYLKFNAIKRPGRPEEIAALYAACADPAMGYLTGADILCDGGCVASGAGPFSR